MHELGIVFHMIKTVERVAEENVLTSVSSVTLLRGNEINLKEIEAC